MSSVNKAAKVASTLRRVQHVFFGKRPLPLLVVLCKFRGTGQREKKVPLSAKLL